MNIDNIRLLADIMAQSGLTRMAIREGDLSIRLERQSEKAFPPLVAEAPVGQSAAEPHEKGQAVDFNLVSEVKSPMVGVFYPSPAPGKPPFVSKGDNVKKGDVLCIIEAMKMMNEIVAEADGTVVDICVEAGQLVEFSQVLFKLY